MNGVMTRGFKNLFRNKMRTALITVIIAICITLTLVVLTIEGGVNNEIAKIESEVGTMIEIRPLGGFGFFNSEPLDPSILELVEEIEGVVQIVPYTSSRLNLPATEEADQDTERGGRLGGIGNIRNMATVIGIGASEETELYYNGTTATLVEGRTLQPQDADTNRAVIGVDIAVQYDINVGDVWEVNEEGLTLEIIGIAESTNRQLARGIFMTLQSVQSILDVEGIQQISIRAENISKVDDIVTFLGANLGEEADIVTYKEALTGQLDQRLGNLSAILKVVLIMSILLGGLLIVITMILTARERASEIGILKALGAYRREIVLQFATESLLLCMISFVQGSILYLLTGSAFTKIFTSMGTTPQQGMQDMIESGVGRSGFTGGGFDMERVRGAMEGFTRGTGGVFNTFNIGDIEAALSINIFLYVLGITIVLGVIGGIIPGIYSSYFKPAEVLRRG